MCSAGQEIYCILWNPKVHEHVPQLITGPPSWATQIQSAPSLILSLVFPSNPSLQSINSLFFHLVLRVVLLFLSNYFWPSAVSFHFFFSKLLLIYPCSLYPQGSSPMCVFPSHTVVKVAYGQSNAIFFLYLLLNSCLCSLMQFIWNFIRPFHV